MLILLKLNWMDWIGSWNTERCSLAEDAQLKCLIKSGI